MHDHATDVALNQDQVALPATGLSYLDLLLGKHEAEAREALGRIAFH